MYHRANRPDDLKDSDGGANIGYNAGEGLFAKFKRHDQCNLRSLQALFSIVHGRISPAIA